jgi:hypothetical protein
METKEIEQQFIKKIDCLPTGERVALKRSCGVMLDMAPGIAFQAFFKCLPDSVNSYDYDKWFAASCYRCLWKEDQIHAIPFENALKAVSAQGCSAIEKRMMVILDCPWESEGFLCSKLARLMKLVLQKGYVVDIPAFLKDLSAWDSPYRNVQKKWVRTFYTSKPDENTPRRTELC